MTISPKGPNALASSSPAAALTRYQFDSPIAVVEMPSNVAPTCTPIASSRGRDPAVREVMSSSTATATAAAGSVLLGF